MELVEPVQNLPMLMLTVQEAAHGEPPAVRVEVWSDRLDGPVVAGRATSSTLGHAAQHAEAALWAWVHGGAIGVAAEFLAHPSIWV